MHVVSIQTRLFIRPSCCTPGWPNGVMYVLSCRTNPPPPTNPGYPPWPQTLLWRLIMWWALRCHVTRSCHGGMALGLFADGAYLFSGYPWRCDRSNYRSRKRLREVQGYDRHLQHPGTHVSLPSKNQFLSWYPQQFCEGENHLFEIVFPAFGI